MAPISFIPSAACWFFSQRKRHALLGTVCVMLAWLAGSRLHIVDVLLTRSLSLVPMVVLGFSNEPIR